MAVAQDTLDRLRSAGLADVDPEIADLLGRELERQRNQIELIASENFTWPSVLEAVGSVPTNKYAEGYPGQALLRRLRGRRRDRAARDRPREVALRRRARERPAARGRAGEHGRLLRAAAAGRHDPGAPARPRRPPDPRPQGELLGPALLGRPLRRLARDEPGRLRRGARAREGAPAEADRLRRLGLPADRRHGASSAGSPTRSGALLMCDMAHFSGLVAAGLHPNPVEHCDIVTSTTHKTLAGPRVGLRALPRGARAPPSTAPSSRACRAARSSTRSRRRRRASGSPRPRRSASTRRRCARTPTRSPRS